MLSNLSPEQITILSAIISIYLYNNLEPSEANALNNLLALITSNLSVQLAQQALNEEKENNNTNSQNQNNIAKSDITPLFTI